VNVSELPLAPLQPYVGQLSQAKLRSGAAYLKGHVRYGKQSDGDPLLHYQGFAGIRRLALADKEAQEFLKWDSLSLNSLTFNMQPTRITIAEVLIQKPFAKAVIGPDKSFNVTATLKASSQPPESAAEGTTSPKQTVQSTQSRGAGPIPIRIDTVRIQDGATQFADLSITPQVSTKIDALQGTVKGLSSKELARADVQLEGKVDTYAPVKITGQVNPLTSEAFTDLSIFFQNVELTSLSPYSAKYAGYPITKGKLTLDLRYNLSKKHLDAANKVLIDQLTLGDKIESPDAVSLPIKLALALLTDRKRRIDIDLPVKGNLNDPDFRYGRLVLQVLGNVITKAATSPFTALSSLLGGKGEELSEVEFPSGSAALPAEKENSIKSLAKALEERPALRLDITGTADPAGDRVALAEVKLREDLKQLKLKEMQDGAKRRSAPADAELIADDEGRLLKDLYKEKFGREARQDINTAGNPTASAVEVLRKQLLETYDVKEDELRALAKKRAEQIREHLVGSTGVSPEQVFLLDAKIEPVAKSGLVPTKLALAPK
jgi:hypothetical protein